MDSSRDRTSTAASPVSPEPVRKSAPAMRIEVDLAGLSDRGKRRHNNEDHFLIGRIDRTWHKVMSNVPGNAIPDTHTETAYGLLVADGMGGHAGGEVASRVAISTFVDLVLQTPDLIMRSDPVLTEEALNRFETRFRRIKDTLTEQVRQNPKLEGMGTTMTMACTIGSDLLIAHVGDSRAYLLRKGVLQPLTHDQTMAQLLLDTGMIAPEELEDCPLRNTLFSVVGTSGGDMDVDLRMHRVADGDQLLLCSDGLTDMVSEADITAILSRSASAEEACRQLVEAALAGGGRDNVTVVLGRYTMRPNG